MSTKSFNIFKISRTDFYLIGIILVIALGVRFIFYSLVSDKILFSIPMVDSKNYDIWAKAIINGNILGEGPFKHGPLYPYFVSLIYYIFGVSIKNVIIIQFLLSSILSILIYLICRELFSRNIGICCAFISAIYGPSIFYDVNLLSVSLINVINTCLLISIYYSIEKNNYYNWCITGFIFGLSILARPNIILLSIFLCFFTFYYKKTNHTYKRVTVCLVVLFSTTLLTISPSIIRNEIVLDELIITNNTGGINFYIGNHKDATGYHNNSGKIGTKSGDLINTAKRVASEEAGKNLSYSQTSRYFYNLAVDDIIADPLNWFRLLKKKTLLFFNYYEYTTSLNYYLAKEVIANFNKFQIVGFSLICPLALTGILISLKSWRKLIPLYSLITVYFISNVMIFVSSEYRFAIMPCFFIFSGLAMSHLLNKFRVHEWKQISFVLLTFCIFFIVANSEVNSVAFKKQHLSIGYINYAGNYRNLNQYDKAADKYKKAIELSTPGKNRAWLTMNYAEMLFDSGNMSEALDNIEKAYKFLPYNAELLSIYSSILTANGIYDKAIAMGEAVDRLEPDNIQHKINLGISYLWAQRDHDADKVFREAIQLDPKINPEVNSIKEMVIQRRGATSRPTQ